MCAYMCDCGPGGEERVSGGLGGPYYCDEGEKEGGLSKTPCCWDQSLSSKKGD